MSSLSHDYRRRIVMASEGSAIGAVGTNGADMQSEIVRAQIDGMVNALIRIDGAETTAGYVFTLGDRACAGLREPTDFRLPRAELVQPVPALAEPIDAAPEPQRSRVWSAIGWSLWGFVLGAVATVWALWTCCRVVS